MWAAKLQKKKQKEQEEREKTDQEAAASAATDATPPAPPTTAQEEKQEAAEEQKGAEGAAVSVARTAAEASASRSATFGFLAQAQELMDLIARSHPSWRSDMAAAAAAAASASGGSSSPIRDVPSNNQRERRRRAGGPVSVERVLEAIAAAPDEVFTQTAVRFELREEVEFRFIASLTHGAAALGGNPQVFHAVYERTPPEIRLRKDDRLGGTLLHYATANKMLPLEEIRWLVEEQPEAIRVQDKIRNTVLHFALVGREELSLDILEYLMDLWPEVASMTTIDGQPPLMYAVCNESVTPEIVRWLISRQPDAVAVMDNSGETIMHQLCESNKYIGMELVNLVHEQLPDAVRTRDKSGAYPLHKLCTNKGATTALLKHVVTLFPDAGPATLYDGRTTVHCALEHNATVTPEMLDYMASLLPEGALQAPTAKGLLPLHVAVQGKAATVNSDILKWVVAQPGGSAGAYQPDHEGRLAMHLACQQNKALNTEFLSQVIDLNPAALEARCYNERQPFFYACGNRHNSLQVLQYLIKRCPASGAPTPDLQSQLPMHAMCETHDSLTLELLQYLYSLQPEACRQVTQLGHTVFHYLVSNEQVDAELLDWCAGLWPEAASEKDHEGLLPLHMYLFNNSAPTVEVATRIYELHPDALDAPIPLHSKPMHVAVGNRHVNPTLVRWLHDLDPEAIRTAADDRSLPIHYFATNNKLLDIDVLTTIVELYPEGMEARGEGGMLPLAKLCQNDACGMPALRFMVEHNPDAVLLPVSPNGSETILHTLCTYANLSMEMIAYIRERYPEAVRERGEHARFPLHCLCCNATTTTAMLRDMVERNPEAATTLDTFGQLPFHLLCTFNSGVSVELLEYLASVTVPAAEREAAAKQQQEEEEARSGGGNAAAEDSESGASGSSPSTASAARGKAHLRRLMSACDAKMRYPLHGICCNEGINLPVLDWVLAGCPEVAAAQDSEGDTALHLLCSFSAGITVPILERLIEAHRDALSQAGCQACLPLHCLCTNKAVSLPILKAVCSAHPAATSTKSSEGLLPLHLLLNNSGGADMRCLTFLHDQNPDAIREESQTGTLPLHFAAASKTTPFPVLEWIGTQYPEAASRAPLPLHIAIGSNGSPSLRAIKFLDSLNPDAVSTPAEDGTLPLHQIFGNDEVTNPDVLLQIVEWLVERHPDGLRATENKSSGIPLHYIGVSPGMSLALLEFMVRNYPESVRQRTDTQQYPLHTAMLTKHVPPEASRWLTEQYPEALQATDQSGYSPFLCAAESPKQSLSLLEYLYAQDPTVVEHRESHERSALHLAAPNASVTPEALEWLVSKMPADVLRKDAEEFLPLHLLLCFNTSVRQELVVPLSGANHEAIRVPCVGDTACLHCACRNPKSPVSLVRWLAEQFPAAVRMSNSQQQLPIHLAAAVSEALSPSLLEIFEEHYPGCARLPDGPGRRLLHLGCMAEKARVDTLEWMCSHDPGAIRAKDNEGALPAHYFMGLNPNPELAEAMYLLKQYPDALHIRGPASRTLLHCATVNEHAGPFVVQLLCSHFPQAVMMPDAEGGLPIQYAHAMHDTAKMAAIGAVMQQMEQQAAAMRGGRDGASGANANANAGAGAGGAGNPGAGTGN